MKLSTLRISNFQCFGPDASEITFEESATIVIGPNGSGKTAILQALSRMFDSNPSHRRVLAGDFHVPLGEGQPTPDERRLLIEADFLLPEAANEDNRINTIPPCFNHMRLDEAGDTLKIRFRLEATMGSNGDIEESLYYVVGKEANGQDKLKRVPRADRNHVAVHYLPARRDPNDQIRSNSTSLLARIVRAVDWSDTAETYNDTAAVLQHLIKANPAIEKCGKTISKSWSCLHKGSHFKDASVAFGVDSLDRLVQNFSVQFTPAHAANDIDYSSLSDGQKSLLYLSLVVSYIEIGRSAMSQNEGEIQGIKLDKLNPPVFSIIGIEEPENSLSPYYLGRINKLLSSVASEGDCQAIVTTHSPSMLRRIDPKQIRFSRLGVTRTASVKTILLPPTEEMDAHKFVREGLLSNPEIYFARMVVLGEGASEDIVLPKLFEAGGLPMDENGIVLAQLGGRHVNYLWRLLSDLGIPYATLLDLDLGRYHGGWGRLKYVKDQLRKIGVDVGDVEMPNWNHSNPLEGTTRGPEWLAFFKGNGLFFSLPLDLDFSLALAHPAQYGIVAEEQEIPDESTCKSVLGKSHAEISWYSEEQQKLFGDYHKLFKVGSKPAAHIEAFSKLELGEIKVNLADQYRELIAYVSSKLEEVFE